MSKFAFCQVGHRLKASSQDMFEESIAATKAWYWLLSSVVIPWQAVNLVVIY